jgi:hypothetical protein
MRERERSRHGYLMIPVSRNPAGRLRSRPNVAAGFFDDSGIFHPIRASVDYDPSRARETRKRKPKVKKRKR